MHIVWLFIITTAIVLFSSACGSTASVPATATPKSSPAANAAPGNVVTVQPQQSSSGSELYAENCMICHKENGTGGKVTIKGKNLKAVDLTGDKLKKATDEKLIGYIRDGVPDEGMPSFVDELRDDQIKLVVAHVRSLQK